MTLMLDLLVAALVGLVTAALVVRPDLRSLGSDRIRIGVGGRIHDVSVSRHDHLPLPLARFRRKVLGDAPGPVKNALGLEVQTDGIPGLRWKLAHAGWEHHSVLWYRLIQLAAGVVTLLIGTAFVAVVGLDWPAPFLVPLVAVVAAYQWPRALLNGRIRERQEYLRSQLVYFLEDIASFLASGQSVERALDRSADTRRDTLTRQWREARAWQYRGSYTLLDAIDRFVARCGTAEVRDGMLLIIAARDDTIRRDQAPRILRDHAHLVTAGIRDRKKIAMAQSALQSTAIGLVCQLPGLFVFILLPSVSQAFRTLGIHLPGL